MSTETRTWSPQQAAALDAVNRWYNSGLDRKQVFRVFGYAGTGKPPSPGISRTV